METELISIVMPTYNRAALIGESIQSVINQTYNNWELIIIDDGSIDGTQDAVSQFRDSRISFNMRTHTGILGKVRNEGIKHAHGEYIAFLDSDDLWCEDKLSTQVDMMKRNPEAGFIFGNGSQFGEGAIQPPDYEEYFVGNVFRKQLLEGKFCIYMPTLMFRRTVLDDVAKINETWKGGGDIDFFYRLSYHSIGIFSNERLVRIRKHSGSTSKKLGILTYVEYLAMIAEFQKSEWITKKEHDMLAAHIYYKMALEQYRGGDAQGARQNFYRHNMFMPFDWKGWFRYFQTLLPSTKP